jgi:hypothetical protein
VCRVANFRLHPPCQHLPESRSSAKERPFFLPVPVAKNSCIPYRERVSFFINKCYRQAPKRSESSASGVRSRSQTRAERGQNETDFFRTVSDLLRARSVRVSSALWIDLEAKKQFFCQRQFGIIKHRSPSVLHSFSTGFALFFEKIVRMFESFFAVSPPGRSNACC